MADCVNRSLISLPLFEEKDYLILNALYIMNNNIRVIDKQISDSWMQLSYVNITNNPIECMELTKFRENVKYDSTCFNTTGEYSFIFSILNIIF